MQTTIQIAWKFAHPPVKVWRAWTDPAIAKLWFGSDPNGKVLEAKFDVRVNGAFSVTFTNSDGSEFTCRGIYQEIDPPNRLVFTWGWVNQPEVDELITLLTDNIETARAEHVSWKIPSSRACSIKLGTLLGREKKKKKFRG